MTKIAIMVGRYVAHREFQWTALLLDKANRSVGILQINILTKGGGWKGLSFTKKCGSEFAFIYILVRELSKIKYYLNSIIIQRAGERSRQKLDLYYDRYITEPPDC